MGSAEEFGPWPDIRIPTQGCKAEEQIDLPKHGVNGIGAGREILDHGPGMPLYQQIFMILRNRIESGEIRPGERLPGEQELAADLGVSRITCKRALNELAECGLVIRQRGRGTRVLDRATGSVVTASIDGWLENVSIMGESTRVAVLEFGYVPASIDVARALAVEPGTTVQRAVRVRYIEGRPMSYLVTHLPEDIGRRFTADDLGNTALLRLLEKAGVTVSEARQSISATLADPEMAAVLDIPSGSPLLDVRRVVLDQHGRPVESIRVCYRPDVYRLEMSMKRIRSEGGMVWSSAAAAAASAGELV
jgi:GntR family transcriptional regulator